MVRGELRDVPGPADRLTVHLVRPDRSSNSESTFANGSGTFQFFSVAPGSYVLEVRNMQGEVIKQQMITVVGPAFETTISLGGSSRREGPAMPAGGATISAKQLRHDPNGRAAREYVLGGEFLVKQDLANARKHMLKAIDADPDYALAHLELGTIAFRSGQIGEARREFERTVELDPKQPVAWGNLASLLFQTKAYGEAESAAQRGLQAMPHDAKLHFIVGASMYARGQFDQGTADHLEQASKSFPNAHLLLGEVLIRLNRKDEARRVLTEGIRRVGGIGEGMGRDLGPAMQKMLESL